MPPTDPPRRLALGNGPVVDAEILGYAVLLLTTAFAALALDRARAAVRWRPWHHSC